MSKKRRTKSSGMDTRPPYMTLDLECIEEPLSKIQVDKFNNTQLELSMITSKLNEMINEQGAQLVYQFGATEAYQYNLSNNLIQTNATKKTLQQVATNVNMNRNQQVKLGMVNKANSQQANIQLVVDPRMGVLLGSVSQSRSTSAATGSTKPTQLPNENVQFVKPGGRTITETVEPTLPQTRLNINVSRIAEPNKTNLPNTTNVRKKLFKKQNSQGLPAEHTSVGGINLCSKSSAVEQIDDNFYDCKEVIQNKVNGNRTYPSLHVTAKCHLRSKDITSQIAQNERTELDASVKNVLMLNPTMFAEWLFQQGLIKSEQYCTTKEHKEKLKLAMYSDQGTFPHSGGYVWVSSCCPDRYISIFLGSIFQEAPHTPVVLIKLIYHWACQTNVQNVMSWVKVTNSYVKNFYTNLRSICTAVICDKSRCLMGGKNSLIQVGVISLGTTSQDENLRQVKVEVLGVLDPINLEIRLRACDPMQDGDKSYKRRFTKILKPLKDWVNAESTIVTDFTIDKNTLHELGFTNISQAAFSDQDTKNHINNFQIMEYLRKIVPRMFQNTLSLLSRQIIQQFLDELVWREMYGVTTARAFNNIILHLSELTKMDIGENLLERLAKISADPFQNWSYSNSYTVSPLISTMNENQVPLITETSVIKQTSTVQTPAIPIQRRGRKRAHQLRVDHSELIPKKIPLTPTFDGEPNKENKTDTIPLQKLYYASMKCDRILNNTKKKYSVNFRCFLCSSKMYSNTDIMEHIIKHVPPQVPGHSDLIVCRYCCTAFSTQHQMTTHIKETHSHFGKSDSVMLVCAICEQKFGTHNLLIDHLSAEHCPSEMPYKCETCGYRTSSHKNVIDHYYETHTKGDGLQCPICLKVIQFFVDERFNANSIHAYLLHMQRHIFRREQGRGNKCWRCSLWFNQKSSLKNHQLQLHSSVVDKRVVPFNCDDGIMVPNRAPIIDRAEIDHSISEIPKIKKVRKWESGPLNVNISIGNLSCQECEEDIDEKNHFPGEQRCQRCRYVTCCWRAFIEHQQQIHNERPLTSVVVPSPLISIPLDKKLKCSCGYATFNGDLLATHLVACKKISAYPVESRAIVLDSIKID